MTYQLITKDGFYLHKFNANEFPLWVEDPSFAMWFTTEENAHNYISEKNLLDVSIFPYNSFNKWASK